MLELETWIVWNEGVDSLNKEIQNLCRFTSEVIKFVTKNVNCLTFDLYPITT
jgi:hypothetical protein